MAQTTLDRVTDQARSMMQRGQQQIGRARQVLQKSATATTPTLSQRLRAMRARNPRSGWRMPARVAWHAGKLVGQVQGARTLAPHAARGWWVGMAGRGNRTQQLGQIARVAGIAFVGTRIAARALPTMRDLRRAARTAPAARAVNLSMPSLSMPNLSVPTLVVPVTSAMRETTQRAWRRLRRGQPVVVVPPTKRWTSSGWLLPVGLIAGFVLGTLMGYLFTPAGPAYVQMANQSQGQPDARFSDS